MQDEEDPEDAVEDAVLPEEEADPVVALSVEDVVEDEDSVVDVVLPVEVDSVEAEAEVVEVDSVEVEEVEEGLGGDVVDSGDHKLAKKIIERVRSFCIVRSFFCLGGGMLCVFYITFFGSSPWDAWDACGVVWKIVRVFW